MHTCPPILQVGVTAMLIASKYEEIWAPELNDFVYISDRAYKKEQILTMEKVMLNALKFNLTGVCGCSAFSSCLIALHCGQPCACRLQRYIMQSAAPAAASAMMLLAAGSCMHSACVLHSESCTKLAYRTQAMLPDG